MREEKSHDLVDFVQQTSQEISQEYERIQKRATEDPGTAGDQGKENWAELLREWLPNTYRVVTKGRIISQAGRTSPQTDVLVLRPSYPEKLLSKKVYLAAGVVAAFECKVTLKSAHITEALENCVAIKSLSDSRKGSPFKDLNAPIFYGLLAHSHSWKLDNSKPVYNIENKLIAEDQRLVDHPRKMIDLICVADLGTWIASKHTFLIPSQRLGSGAPQNQSGRLLIATTAYLGHTNKLGDQANSFQPIGTLISQLLSNLAWEDPECRTIAEYYQKTNIAGSGHGRIREWLNSIFSEETKTKLERNLAGIERSIFPTGDAWNEWHADIIS